MKYPKEHRDLIIECLDQGLGRVKTCETVGISYKTLTRWMKDDVNFVNDIKKAELVGEDVIKDAAEKAIQDKFSTHWQSAAWWLERKYSNQYGQKIETKQDVDLSRSDYSGYTKEELKQIIAIENAAAERLKQSKI